MYRIGMIANTHGVRGELKIISETDFNRFEKGKTVIINDQTYKIQSVRDQNKFLLIKFEGFNTINDVERLKGTPIYSDEPYEIEEEDTYHYQALIGTKVYTDKGEYLGITSDIIEVPHGHLIEVKDGDRKNLIPFVQNFIKEVTNEKIVITPIEGLIKWL